MKIWSNWHAAVFQMVFQRVADGLPLTPARLACPVSHTPHTPHPMTSHPQGGDDVEESTEEVEELLQSFAQRLEAVRAAAARGAREIQVQLLLFGVYHFAHLVWPVSRLGLCLHVCVLHMAAALEGWWRDAKSFKQVRQLEPNFGKIPLQSPFSAHAGQWVHMPPPSCSLDMHASAHSVEPNVSPKQNHTEPPYPPAQVKKLELQSVNDANSRHVHAQGRLQAERAAHEAALAACGAYLREAAGSTGLPLPQGLQAGGGCAGVRAFEGAPLVFGHLGEGRLEGRLRTAQLALIATAEDRMLSRATTSCKEWASRKRPGYRPDRVHAQARAAVRRWRARCRRSGGSWGRGWRPRRRRHRRRARRAGVWVGAVGWGGWAWALCQVMLSR